ncbi:MAG: hypothetical protein AAGF50_15040, partial [Pseudomonadota bacterium]
GVELSLQSGFRWLRDVLRNRGQGLTRKSGRIGVTFRKDGKPMNLRRRAILIAPLVFVTSVHATETAKVYQSSSESDVVALFDCQTGEAIADSRMLNRPLNESEKRLAATGLCVLKQDPDGATYCEPGNCTGTCRLRNLPLACRCE